MYFHKVNLVYSNIYPTRCNVTQFILSRNCSTCFGWYHHLPSGAQTTVSTASDICHTVTATCRYRGGVWTCNCVVQLCDSSTRHVLRLRIYTIAILYCLHEQRNMIYVLWTNGWECNVQIHRVLLCTRQRNDGRKCGCVAELQTHRFRVCELKRLADLSTSTRPLNP